MNTIYINGKYLSQKLTGVQRYAREIVYEFENNSIYKDYSFLVVCPKDAVIPLDYKHVKYVKIKGSGYYFEQFTLPKYIKKNKGKILLNLCNLAPIKFPGACTIHDLNLIDNKEFYSFLYRFVVKYITKRNIKKYDPIFTVSNFSKKRIEDYYNVKNVVVSSNGVREKEVVDIDNQKLKFDRPYFFTVGSMNKTKNLNYIIDAAKQNPEYLFVITGGAGNIYSDESLESLDNVVFTGYLGDKDINYLYSKCEAFILPSFYEGFGIPPLEAIACGCKRIILSDIEVFRECYGDYVSYCDPNNVNTIKPLLKESKIITEDERNEILSKYTWFNVSKIIFDSIKEKI